MFEELGTNSTTVSQVISSKDKIVFKAIQDGIDRYNTQHSQTNLDKVHTYSTIRSGENNIMYVYVGRVVDIA